VIDALAKVSVGQPHLVVVGGDQPKDYIDKAGASNVGSCIHFVGAQEDIRPFLWGSDLFVFPTRYEPFGFVIIEAMAAGLPVITSKIAGAADWIEDGKEGILLDDPFDSQELAQAIDKLLGNTDGLATMGNAAQAKAREFDWDRITEMTLEVYQSVL
jgi:glycosyltransferase involved in cell wall biosynthesis